MTRVATIAAALLVLSIAGPVGAQGEVPLRGTLEGTVTSTPLDPPWLAVALEADGTATHFGRFTASVSATVNPAAITASGTYLLTAANGDSLTASFTGVGSVVGPGTLRLTDTATITGGTGRFAGATGSFTVVRTYLPGSGTTWGSFQGVLSVPAA